jgi:hypothetical protein
MTTPWCKNWAIVFLRLLWHAWRCKNLVFASPSQGNVIHDRWHAIVLQSDASPRHFFLSSFRKRVSSSDSALISCAFSRLNTTSIIMTRCKRTLPMNFWLHHFRHFAVFHSLKSRMQHASVFWSVHHQPSATTSMYPGNRGQMASNLKRCSEWTSVLV